MVHVGLVFVGLILFVNGLVSLGRIPARSAAVLNLLVGGVQILLPTPLAVALGPLVGQKLDRRLRHGQPHRLDTVAHRASSPGWAWPRPGSGPEPPNGRW